VVRVVYGRPLSVDYEVKKDRGREKSRKRQHSTFLREKKGITKKDSLTDRGYGNHHSVNLGRERKEGGERSSSLPCWKLKSCWEKKDKRKRGESQERRVPVNVSRIWIAAHEISG